MQTGQTTDTCAAGGLAPELATANHSDIDQGSSGGAIAGRVLYADDEESSRIMVGELLRRYGHVCDTAPDCLVAAQMLDRARYDCLVSDINMLGNAELEFVRQVASRHPLLPVVLVTAYPSVATAAESLRLPVLAYLMKPVESAILGEAVREAICRSRLHRQFDTTRTKLDHWLAEVGQLADGLKGTPRLPATGVMDAYLMITYRNTLDALLCLKTVLELSLSDNSGASSTAAPGGPTPLLLISALRDAIDTLEKTKDAFRSRELRDLRHQLQALLDTTSQQSASRGLATGRVCRDNPKFP